MKKSLLTLTLVTPSLLFAQAPTVYGQIKLSLSNVSQNNSTGMSMNSMGSRFGIKGEVDLNEEKSLKGLYFMEFGWNPNDQRPTITDSASATHTTESPFVNRDIYAGLKGGLGTLKLGRISAAYKEVGVAMDPFYHTSAGISHAGSSYGLSPLNNGRYDNSILYNFRYTDFDLNLMMIIDETHNSQNDYIVGVDYYLEKVLKLSAHYFMDKNIDATKKVDYLRLGISGKLSDFEAGLSYETGKNKTYTNDSSYLYAALSYNLTEKMKLSFSYGQEDDYLVGTTYEKEGSSMNFGGTYTLAPNTILHALISKVDYTDAYSSANSTGDRETVSIGIHQKF